MFARGAVRPISFRTCTGADETLGEIPARRPERTGRVAKRSRRGSLAPARADPRAALQLSCRCIVEVRHRVRHFRSPRSPESRRREERTRGFREQCSRSTLGMYVFPIDSSLGGLLFSTRSVYALLIPNSVFLLSTTSVMCIVSAGKSERRI